MDDTKITNDMTNCQMKGDDYCSGNGGLIRLKLIY